MLYKNLLLTTIISNTFWYLVISDEEPSSSLNVAKQTSSNLSSTVNYNQDNSIWFINLHHYLSIKCLTIFLPLKNIAIQVKNIFHQSSLFNYFNTLLNVLFCFETITILFIIFIFTLFVHRRNVIEIPPNTVQHDRAHSQLLSNFFGRLLTKVFHYLNFYVIFSHFFALVDSTFRSYFQTQTVINQFHYGLAGAYSIQGRRSNMEDCFSLKNNISADLGIDYYAVFDGHGGPNAALYAEKAIYEQISKRVKDIVNESKSKEHSKLSSFESLTLSSMKNVLNEEIISVDKTIVDNFTKKADISGTTALIAIRILHLNTLLVANVGDSRGILCDSKGGTIPLSFDHKPCQLKEYRRILDAGGFICLKGVYRVNGILAISRALGDYPLKNNRLIIPDPDILTFDLNELKPKFMILATDGFWDTFKNEHAVQFVNNELSKMNQSEKLDTIALLIAKKLANEAYIRESYDNITVIFILFDKDFKLKSSAISGADLSGTSSPPRSTSPTKKSSTTNTNNNNNNNNNNHNTNNIDNNNKLEL